MSQYPLPRVSQPSIEFIIENLVKAYRIFNESIAVSWQFLDAPPAEYAALTWQPPALHGRFATDGYIWADPEQFSTNEVQGYVRCAPLPV